MRFALDGYSPGRDLPLRGYAALLTLHIALVGAFIAALKARGRSLPTNVPARDLALLGVGTWRAARVATKDPIASPVRAPFTQVEEVQSTTEVRERPRGRGLQRAIGELVTCPYCLGSWIAAGFLCMYAVSPRTARFLGSILTVQALNTELNRHLR